jgi:hypothetical protein
MYNKVPFLIKYFCLIEESIITHLPKCHIFYRFLPIMSRKIAHLAIFLIFLALYGCADKYQSYRSNYPFKSPNGQPDYTNLDYWAAHPDKKDPSDSIPAPLRSETRDTLADVFFLHPTTFTDKKEADRPNAAIDDDYMPRQITRPFCFRPVPSTNKAGCLVHATARRTSAISMEPIRPSPYRPYSWHTSMYATPFAIIYSITITDVPLLLPRTVKAH